MTDTSKQNEEQLHLPSGKTLDAAFRLSAYHDKKIDAYFYLDSLRGNVKIVKDGNERVICRDDEYTSPIVHLYNSDQEYIAVTENTIYIISSKTRRESKN